MFHTEVKMPVAIGGIEKNPRGEVVDVGLNLHVKIPSSISVATQKRK